MSGFDGNDDSITISDIDIVSHSRFASNSRNRRARKKDVLQGDVNAAGRLLGLSPRRVQQLVATGIIERSIRGDYDLAALMKSYIKFQIVRLESGTIFEKATAMQSLRALAGLSKKRGAPRGQS